MELLAARRARRQRGAGDPARSRARRALRRPRADDGSRPAGRRRRRATGPHARTRSRTVFGVEAVITDTERRARFRFCAGRSDGRTADHIRAAPADVSPPVSRGPSSVARRRFVLLGEPQADGDDTAVRDPLRQQRDRTERHDVALPRRALELLGEEIGERKPGVACRRPTARRFRPARRASRRPTRRNRRAGAGRARPAAACRRRSGRAPAPFRAAPADRDSRPRAPARPPPASGCARRARSASASPRTE